MTIQESNRAKLTKRLVESNSPDASKRILIWDTEITGFCVRIYPTGRKTYFFQYRNARKETKFLKIGVHGNITAESAREQAKQLALKVSSGEDPSIKQPEKTTTPTIETLANRYLEHHAEIKKRPKSIKEDKYMLKNYILKEFGTLKVDQISLEDIQKLHTSLNKKRVLSNRILSLLHKMFSLAVQWKWRTDNPVSGIEKYQEHKRTCWLQEDELTRLLAVLDASPNQTVPTIIRLLLLTGARKHEVLEATWDQFDLDKGVWTKRAHTTKQKKMEHSPLSPAALDILRKLASGKMDSRFLFPGKVNGTPLQDIKKSWATICKQANLQDFTIHDLRHTYASHLVSSGLSLSIVGKLLGHTQASTTQRYAHLADEPLREATTLFSEKLKGLSAKQPS
jgi:integrase